VNRKWSTRLRIVGRRAWGLPVSSRSVVSAGGSSSVFRKTFAADRFMRSASWRTATL